MQEINGFGRRLLIHGVNMSVGYNFEPEWFACGQSPLCVEVDRLVKTGVVVVVAAGNTGYGTLKSASGATSAGMALTINDPGNADLAITVGSTHRDMPHVYGVSYFSSKGPTGDGRMKPDLLAPGEKIISCATGTLKKEGAKDNACDYVETSGTSMAAPHVSGVIAALPLRPRRVHRQGGTGEGDFPVDRDRPAARPLFSGRWSGRSDARHSIRLKFSELTIQPENIMNDIAGIPYVEAEFDKNGNLKNQVSLPSGVTDLIVISHGWNNDAAAARDPLPVVFPELRRGRAA